MNSWGLIGLTEITGALAAMIAAGRLPHALLFAGPPGGGKYSLARALAAAVNCLKPPAGGGPCGQCLSCRKTARDTHPDVITLAPSGRARQIKMEDVQTLRGDMAYKPFEGRAKFFILREADRLNADSGNALLKTLEEPPPNSHLILTSASEFAVLTTIVSRCLRLRLPSLPTEQVLETLERERSLTGPRARLLAALAAGALGPALALGPQEVWDRWRALNEIMEIPGGPARLERAWQWTAAAAAEEDRSLNLALMRLWWRETVRLYGAGPRALEGPDPEPGQTAWAARLTPESLERVGRALARLEDSLARFIKPELAFENFWLTVLAA